MNFSELEQLFPVISIFLVLVSFYLHKKFKAANEMSAKETIANVSVFLIWKYVFYAGGVALQLIIFKWLSQFAIGSIESSLGSFVFIVLVMDFVYYWKHRYEHEISFFWCQHAVHHNSNEFNFSTSLRLPWIGSYINWVFFVPAILVGFSPEQVLIGYKVILTYQYLVHTEYVRNLGFLELILNTPSNHRVHHGKNAEYVDKNYGGILIIWDRMFGTYEPEVAPVKYGTLNEMKSKNPIMINLQPWIDLYRNSRKKGSFVSRIAYIILP